MTMQSVMVKRRLKQALEEEILLHGSELPVTSARMIEKMINTGIQRMSIQGVLERQDKLLLAEQNLKSFIKSAAQTASRGSKNSILGAQAIEKAKIEHCPLWPFC